MQQLVGVPCSAASTCILRLACLALTFPFTYLVGVGWNSLHQTKRRRQGSVPALPHLCQHAFIQSFSVRMVWGDEEQSWRHVSISSAQLIHSVIWRHCTLQSLRALDRSWVSRVGFQGHIRWLKPVNWPVARVWSTRHRGKKMCFPLGYSNASTFTYNYKRAVI